MCKHAKSFTFSCLLLVVVNQPRAAGPLSKSVKAFTSHSKGLCILIFLDTWTWGSVNQQSTDPQSSSHILTALGLTGVPQHTEKGRRWNLCLKARPPTSLWLLLHTHTQTHTKPAFFHCSCDAPPAGPLKEQTRSWAHTTSPVGESVGCFHEEMPPPAEWHSTHTKISRGSPARHMCHHKHSWRKHNLHSVFQQTH